MFLVFCYLFIILKFGGSFFVMRRKGGVLEVKRNFEPLVLGGSSNFGGWEIAPCFTSSYLLLFLLIA